MIFKRQFSHGVSQRKRMGLGRPHPFWRSGNVQCQGGIVFHRIYPLRLKRFQMSYDLIGQRSLLGKEEILKASEQSWPCSWQLLHSWSGSGPLLSMRMVGKEPRPRSFLGTRERGFLNTKRWTRSDAYPIRGVFVISNGITPRSWRRVIVYLRLFRSKEATSARPTAAPCGRARY